MWSNPQFPVDLVTFTEEILNGKLHFLCCDTWTLNRSFTVYTKTKFNKEAIDTVVNYFFDFQSFDMYKY